MPGILIRENISSLPRYCSCGKWLYRNEVFQKYNNCGKNNGKCTVLEIKCPNKNCGTSRIETGDICDFKKHSDCLNNTCPSQFFQLDFSTIINPYIASFGNK
jgi:hypothetical protein